MIATHPLPRPRTAFAVAMERLDPDAPRARAEREREAALADVREFARHVHIKDPDGRDQAFADVAWSWQWVLIALWAITKLSVVLKARQLGVSWLVAAYALWVAIRRPGQLVLLISKKEDDAKDLLAKVKYIHDRLPEEWRPRAEDTTTTLTFPALGSRIEAMPASEDAGRGRTANLVVLDEHAHQPHARQIMQSVSAAADRGQIISLSSAKGRGALHSAIFLAARAGKALVRVADAAGRALPLEVTPDIGPNGWRGIFVPYDAHPERDAAWRARKRAEQSELTDAEFVQEYPRDAVEAIQTSGQMVFRAEDLALQVIEPGTSHRAAPDLVVFRAPAPGRTYVLGADVGEGLETSDWSSAAVIDRDSGEQVAHLRGRWSTDVFAGHIAAVAAHYAQHATPVSGAPVLVAVERNNHGLAVIQELLRIRQAGAGWRQVKMVGTGAKRRSGWLTTNANRPVLVRQLEVAIRTGAIRLHDAGTIDQFAMFAYNGDGRPEAQEGHHDDDVMAIGIANQVRMRPGPMVLDVSRVEGRAA
jgi:hypothetical protein